MTCTQGTNVIACGPPRGVFSRHTMPCPECSPDKEPRRQIERWDGAWYGITLFCECGDHWMDGQRMERPFRQGWRNAARADFERMWRFAAPADLYDAYIKADVEVACADDWAAAEGRRQEAHAAILAHQERVAADDAC